jgi:hypothetical protein
MYIPKILFKGWGVAQEGEHLPCKCKALRSNPSTTKKKKKKTIIFKG